MTELTGSKDQRLSGHGPVAEPGAGRKRTLRIDRSSKGVMKGIPALGAILVIALACGDGTTDAPLRPSSSPTIGGSLSEEPPTVTLAPIATATTGPTGTPAPTTVPIPASTTLAPGVLAAGLLDLPAAGAFGEPGFHEVLTASVDAPSDPAPGTRLVLRLWD